LKEPPVRLAALPGGRSLTVRKVTPADTDELERLYRELCDDDRYRRFFSLYRPDRSTVAKWAADNEDGKLRLAAFVDRGTGEEEMVGDALCVPLPDGDGEFALAVAGGWRGWLGAYLLDALADCAAEMGMRNLQADILTENRRMLAVVKARGYAVLNHPDFNEVRVTTGTVPAIPAWPGTHDRPRILVETRGSRWTLHGQLAQCGFQVITCPGPGRRCPDLAGGPCPLAAGADAIVLALPADDPDAAALVEGHARLHAGVPLCVVDRPGTEPADWPPGAFHLSASSPGEDLRSGPLALSAARREAHHDPGSAPSW
jgi:RimJ/RimL family protein N-acetyltransferase